MFQIVRVSSETFPSAPNSIFDQRGERAERASERSERSERSDQTLPSISKLSHIPLIVYLALQDRCKLNALAASDASEAIRLFHVCFTLSESLPKRFQALQIQYLINALPVPIAKTGFPVAFQWPFARLFALKDGQRRLQDGFWTRLRQFKFKMEPGRPKAPPRFSQDGSKALLRRPMTDPKSTKIHEKWMLRANPILVSFFVRFSIDFQSIFRPPQIRFFIRVIQVL